MDDDVHAIARKDIDETADVIGIGVRGDNDIYCAVPPRGCARERADDGAARRAAVDEDLPSRGRVDEYRVALSDVEKRDGEHAPAILPYRRGPYDETKKCECENSYPFYPHAFLHEDSIRRNCKPQAALLPSPPGSQDEEHDE